MREIENKVSDYYSEKVRKFGSTPQGVDWNSVESQEMRFEQLSRVLPENEEESFTVLDYGCGYGACYSFLKTRYRNVQYTGFDISVDMIKKSKELFANTSTTWVSNETSLQAVDYVIASGIFNVRLNFSDQAWHAYIIETLDRINGLAVKGFAFNLLTSYSDTEFMKDYLYYASPENMFAHCKTKFSRHVALLHDYPLYEFSILVRK